MDKSTSKNKKNAVVVLNKTNKTDEGQGDGQAFGGDTAMLMDYEKHPEFNCKFQNMNNYKLINVIITNLFI